MTSNVLIDAVSRFEARREASLGLDQVDELATIGATIPKEVGNYIEEMQQSHDPIAGLLVGNLANGFTVGVSVAKRESLEVGIDDDEHTYSEHQYGVGNILEGDELKPEIRISSSAFRDLYGQFNQYFGDSEEISPQQRTEVAATAAGWLSLGRWTVELLDPTQVDDVNANVPALKAIMFFAGMDDNEAQEGDRLTRVGESLEVLSYRLAGAMAYKGVARYLKRNSLPLGDALSLSTHQRLTSAFFDQAVRNQPASINTLNFAMAKPLLKQELDQVLSVLDPVASELLSS